MEGVIIISKIKELFLTIEEKTKVNKELRDKTEKLKLQANDLDISELKNCSYDECRNIFAQIHYYIDNKNLLNELSKITEEKKIEKYPKLLKPTYYPEIDLLDIPDSEKLRLDKVTRYNITNYISKNNIHKLEYPLSIDDLELLKEIGIVKKIILSVNYVLIHVLQFQKTI